MGADSSTLNSVECLNGTLESIEDRLFDIEDTYLRHESSVVLDTCIVVGDKVISCNANINLVAGPVLGRLNSTSIRIGMEINRSATLEFFVFVADEETALMGHRFVRSVSYYFDAGVFQVCSIDGLDCKNTYLIYIGGISKEQVTTNILHVALPKKYESNTKIFMINSSRISDTRNLIENTWMSLASTISTTPCLSKCCKVVVHNGNLFQLSTKIRHKLVEIVHYVVDENFSTFHWSTLIRDFENTVYSSYRDVFMYSAVKRVLQQCCAYFGAGEGESMAQEFAILVNDTYSSNWTKHLIPPVDPDSISSRLRSKASQDDMSTARSIFSSTVHHEALDQKRMGRSEVEEIVVLKNMTFSLLARIIRKAYWRYCLQLWDDKIDNAISLSSLFEEKLSLIISTKKRILQLSRLSVLMRPENDSFTNKISEQLGDLNQALVASATELGEFVCKHGEGFKGSTVFQIGQHAFVCWETCWSWILPDGTLSIPLPVEIETTQDSLDELVHFVEAAEMEIKGLFIIGRHVLTGSVPSLPMCQLGLGYNHDLKVAVSDSKKLIDFVSRWQCCSADRAVLLLVPNDDSRYSLSGVVRNFNDDSHQPRQVPFLMIGCTCDMSSSNKKLKLLTRPETISNGLMINTGSVTVQNFCGFFVGEFISEQSSSSNRSSGNGVYRGQEAGYKLLPYPLLPLTPAKFHIMVGQVRSHSAIILVESEVPCVAHVHCINGVSGVDHVIRQHFYSLSPQKLEFCNLEPNRNYDVFIDGSSSWANFTTRKDSKFSFQNANAHVQNAIRQVAIKSLQDDASINGEQQRGFKIAMIGGIHCKNRDVDTTNICRFVTALHKMAASPWNNCDLIIHGANLVDWSPSIDYVIRQFQNCESGNVSIDDWKLETRVTLRNCFHMYINGGLIPSGLFAHIGSHYYVCAPQIELVNSMALNSLSEARREISSTLLQHLIGIVDSIESEYYGSLWDGYSNNCFGVRVIEEEKIMILEIKPVFSMSNRWLGLEHYLQMRLILGDTSLLKRICTVIILTAAPIVACDHIYQDYSSLDDHHGPHFHIYDAADILDFCVEMMMVDAPKEVVLLSSHNNKSFSTTVSFDHVSKQSTTAKGSSTNKAKLIRQFCLGPTVGDCELPPFPKSGIISGEKCEYFFQHEYSSDNHCFCELTWQWENDRRSLDIILMGDKEIDKFTNLGAIVDYEKLQDEEMLKILLKSLVAKFEKIWIIDSAYEDNICYQVVLSIDSVFDMNEELLLDVFHVVAKEFHLDVSLISKLILASDHVVQRLQMSTPSILKRPSSVVVGLFLEWIRNQNIYPHVEEGCLLHVLCNSFDDFKRIIRSLIVAQIILEFDDVQASSVD